MSRVPTSGFLVHWFLLGKSLTAWQSLSFHSGSQEWKREKLWQVQNGIFPDFFVTFRILSPYTGTGTPFIFLIIRWTSVNLSEIESSLITRNPTARWKDPEHLSFSQNILLMKGAKVVWKINIQSKERQKTSRSVRIQTRLGLRKENAVGIKKPISSEWKTSKIPVGRWRENPKGNKEIWESREMS